MSYWRVPRLFPGCTMVLLGGGPSLNPDDALLASKNGFRVLAINDAYLIAPFADVHYFCDERWWKWHKDRPEFSAFGGIRVTLENLKLEGMHHLQNMGRDGLASCPWGVSTGGNSGIQAINLAAHLGAAKLLLLGFDMRPGHWHEGHQTPTNPKVYENSMLPRFPAVAAALAALNIECINCSPGSALDVFPRSTMRRELGTLGARFAKSTVP